MYRFEPPPPPQFGGGSEPEDPYAQATVDTRPAPPPGRTAPTGNPYAAPSGAWGAPDVAVHPRGTTALVLGILSVCGLSLLGPIAWGIAQTALREIDQSPYPAANRSQLAAARILGIIGTCFLALTAIYFVSIIIWGIVSL
ncbi:DUF4190 domain-containing protein [Serinicoccus profundi]|uniref:DUF4190 domain-containing protein n=1 Tax=Serinicoccus profundi TaxID=1078471 RepID=UPI000255ED1E|nr:DUF4190 domain-containing protein [Serinicoccus profundi]